MGKAKRDESRFCTHPFPYTITKCSKCELFVNSLLMVGAHPAFDMPTFKEWVIKSIERGLMPKNFSTIPSRPRVVDRERS